MKNAFRFSIKTIFFFASVALVGMTENAIRTGVNDAVFIIDSAFVLSGGVCLATWCNAKVEALIASF